MLVQDEVVSSLKQTKRQPSWATAGPKEAEDLPDQASSLYNALPFSLPRSNNPNITNLPKLCRNAGVRPVAPAIIEPTEADSVGFFA